MHLALLGPADNNKGTVHETFLFLSIGAPFFALQILPPSLCEDELIKREKRKEDNASITFSGRSGLVVDFLFSFLLLLVFCFSSLKKKSNDDLDEGRLE